MALHIQSILLVILILVSGLTSMAEAALLSISKFKVRHLVEKKRFGAIYAKKLKDNPERLLSTVLILNNLVNTAIAAITTTIALELFESNAIGIAIGIATLVILIVGDIIPKSIGTNNNDLLAPVLAVVVWYSSIALYPLITFLDDFLKAVNKLIGTKSIPIITKEELKSIVKYSEEEGSIKNIEKKMIQRIFDFENTTVADVMTSRKFIVSVNANMHIKDVLQIPARKMYSRFPVYEKSKDNIVGILYFKDMLNFVKEGKFDISVSQIMRKPLFVFANKKMDTMLKLFQNRKQHMAIVIDEKARILGLVTIENILEEVVGEIIDESDRLSPSIMQISKNEWLVKGSSEIDELNNKTGMPIKRADFVDLDSFVLATLNRTPKINDVIEHQNYKLIIDDAQGKKVLKARIVKS